MSTAALPAPRRNIVFRSFLPLVLVVLAAVLANMGVRLAPNANAATDNVTVSANAGAIASVVSNNCTGAIALTFTMNSTMYGTCQLTFGSSNTSGITLSVDDSTQGDQFWTQGTNNFVDGPAACGAISGDQIGYHVNTGGTATVNQCTAVAAGTNGQFSDIPNDTPSVIGADTVCTTPSAGNTFTCPVEVGLIETGGNAPAASYTGTMVFTSS